MLFLPFEHVPSKFIINAFIMFGKSGILQDLDTFEKWNDTLPFYKNVINEGVVISE